MKRILMVLFAAGNMAITGMVFADSGADLSKAKGCMACHAAADQKFGPPFKAIAAQYKGQKDAEAKLIASLKAGPKDGKGHPVIATATDAELKTLVQYVRSTK